jgi:hypothetical protein
MKTFYSKLQNLDALILINISKKKLTACYR